VSKSPSNLCLCLYPSSNAARAVANHSLACLPSSPSSGTVCPSSLSIAGAFVLTSRAEFLDAIRSVNPPSRWKILVIDEHSQQLLNSVLKQFDILEENVTRALPPPVTVPSPSCFSDSRHHKYIIVISHRIHNEQSRGTIGLRRGIHGDAHLCQRRPHHPRFFGWTAAVCRGTPLLHRWYVTSPPPLSFCFSDTHVC
jgi:hypothetical protein